MIGGQRRGGRIRRPLANRQRHEDDEELLLPDDVSDDEGLPLRPQVVLPDDKKVGKKKMAKLEAKAEKKSMREYVSKLNQKCSRIHDCAIR